MVKATLLTRLFFAFIAIVSFTFSGLAQTTQEKAEMVQQALSIPEVQAYFKIKQKPERKQLYILDNGKILNTLPVSMFGNKVIFAKRGAVDSNNYIEFLEADFKPALSKLVYAYPAESVMVEVKMVKKGNKWTKSSAAISPYTK